MMARDPLTEMHSQGRNSLKVATDKNYPFWTFKDLFKVIGESLIWSIVVSVIFLRPFLADIIESNFIWSLIDYLIFYLAIFLFIFLSITKKYHQSFFESLKIQKPKNFNLFLVIPISFLIWYLTKLFPVDRAVEPPLVKIFSSNINFLFLNMGIGLVVSPFFEELFWRGYIYPLVKLKLGKIAAIFLISLLFTLAHVAQLWGAWQAIFYNLVFSLTFTILREFTDSTLTSILAHLSFNTIVAIAILLKFFHVI